MKRAYKITKHAFAQQAPITARYGNFRQGDGACPLYEVFWKSAAIVQVKAEKNRDFYEVFKENLKPGVEFNTGRDSYCHILIWTFRFG